MKVKFLSFCYKIPKVPSKCRVYIWRTLKDLGSASLSQGTAILPNTKKNFEALKKLRDEVEKNGGFAAIAYLSFVEDSDVTKIIDEFNRLRSEEYIELSKECAKLIFEIDWLIENEKYRFSELEENEEEFKKLNSWFTRIETRDYYKQSISKKDSKAMLSKAGAKIHEYANHVYLIEKKH